MKLLISSMPWTDTESPIMAPALLKSMCLSQGIKTNAIDLNQEVLYYIKQKFNQDESFKLQQFFYGSTKTFDSSKVIDVIDFCVDRILDFAPTHVALSLLTYTSQTACEWICFRLRQKSPKTRIIIGGAGIFNTLESKVNFGQKLLEQKQIDYYIKGDGDLSLPELVIKDNASISGVNGKEWKQLVTLDNQPFPDYEDYVWKIYQNQSIGVVGSRGCVRNCTFCDIHEHWKKYQWRTGQDIFDELLWHNKKTGVKNFKFQDSLINGNQIEFRKLMTLLASHNDQNPKNKITWSSFFIFRPQSQMNESDWIDISKSASLLIVGIESLSEKVRFHMGKKFTNRDMHYCFDMCMKYKIRCHMLLIVGYVTDDEKTHAETIQWFDDYSHYANNPITSVSLGGTLGILPGTELFRKQEELGIRLKDEQFDHNWTIESTNNTPQKRVAWHKEQTNACQKAGFLVTSMTDNHLLMEQMMK
jgi:hypothetical protein